MYRIIAQLFGIIITILSGWSCAATTYNCFEVDKKASLGFNGGAVIVNGDKSQKSCKFSINDVTVDSPGSTPSSLKSIFKFNSDSNVTSFRNVMLSPFSQTTIGDVTREFDTVFSPAAQQVGQCLAAFSKGQPQDLGLNSVACRSKKENDEFEFGGLTGTASESILMIGVNLEKEQLVLLLVISERLASDMYSGHSP